MKRLLFVALFLLLPVYAMCYETTVDGIKYIYEEYMKDIPYDGSNDVVKTCRLIGVEGSIQDSLIIPESLDGFIVVCIGWNFLENSSELKYVELPLYCRELGDYAFKNCSKLESVVFESHIDYVCPNVFQGCNNLRTVKCYALAPPTYWREVVSPSIHFSDEVRNNATLYVRPNCKDAYKESVVWSELPNIEEMDVPAFRIGDERIGYVNGVRYAYTVLSVTDKTCLFGRMVSNTRLVSEDLRYHEGPHWRAIDYGTTGTIRIPSVIDGFTVTELGYGCLHYAKPDSVIIPGTVKKIWGNMCTSEISKSLIIGASVEHIGPSIPSAGYISVDPSNTVYDSRNDCNAIIHTSSNTLIRGSRHMHIPDGIAAIGDYALGGCSLGEDDMELLSSVKKIGEGAFADAILDSISFSIPSFMTEIPANLFRNCGGLMAIEFHDKITKIGDRSFAGCWNLKEADFPASLVYIGDEAFHQCFSLLRINYNNSDSLNYIGICAFFETGILNVELPNHAIVMGRRAFGGARPSYRSIIIPENFDGFGGKAFSVYNSSDQTYRPTERGSENLTMEALSVIISKIEHPSAIDNDLFDEKTVATTILYVPDGALSLYQSTSGWNQFQNIKEMSEMTTGVNKIKDHGPESVYAPNGIKHNSSVRGLGIIKLSNGETRKVLIK